MRAVANKSCHRVVLELGRSLFRSVALATISAELAPVRLSLLVAAHARNFCKLVAIVDVARLALGGLVRTFQREPFAVLPDQPQVFEMLGRRVTLGTVVAKLSFVLVFLFVTVDTGELVGAVDPVLVAVLALAAHLGLGVEADEREARILVVGEGSGARPAFHVATSARLVGELPLVRPPVLVTGDAAALGVGELLPPLVALAAVQGLVLAQEGKAKATVVDLCLFPGTRGEVAGSALGEVGGHRMERTVAVGASAGRGTARHLGFGVALGTGLFKVLSVKGDPRVAAVRFQPGGKEHAPQDVTRGVAGLALLGELNLAEPVNALVAAPAILR